MIPVDIACDYRVRGLVSDLIARHYEQRAVMSYRVGDSALVVQYDAPGG
jgi:hypothetical protein